MAFFSQQIPMNAHEGDMGVAERKMKVEGENKKEEEEEEPPRRSTKRSLEEGSSPSPSSNNIHSSLSEPVISTSKASGRLDNRLPRLPPGFAPKAPLIPEGEGGRGGKRRAGRLPLGLPEPDDYDLDRRNWQGETLGVPITRSKPSSWATNNCCWKVNSSDNDDDGEERLESMADGVDEEDPITIFCPAGEGCFKRPPPANTVQETAVPDIHARHDEDEDSLESSPNSLKEGIDRLHHVGKIRAMLGLL